MPIATGGIITTVEQYKIHTFTSSGTINFTSGGLVDVLVVAGGGAGGSWLGGGGGAGGMIYQTNFNVAAGNYNITVGNGGVGYGPNLIGGNGGNSSFNNLIAIGGGGGGTYSNKKGAIGGSGGGAGGNDSSTILPGTTGTAGQGHNGGGASRGSNGYVQGGGGGAGSAGGDGTSSNGHGGAGLACTISGTMKYYAGGGGSSSYNGGAVGYGGLGGGGAGGTGIGVSGTPNTGGGGGGTGSYGPYGAAGGSGIVIIRYLGIDPDVMIIKNGIAIDSDIVSIKTGTPISLNKIQSELTIDDYKNNGMSLIPISSSTIALLNPQFSILTYSAGLSALTNGKLTGTSFNKLILAKGDISLSSANCLNSVALTSSVNGTSMVKLIVSIDSATTWKTFNAGAWNTINPTLTDVNNNGITPTILNSITKEQWNSLLGTITDDSKIRFGYLLNQGLSTESCNTNNIAINIDMMGSWDFKFLGTVYDEFIGGRNGDVVTVKLLADGDFKINY